MITFDKISAIYILIFAIILRIISSSTADFSYIVVAIYAFLGRKQAIQALAISWLLTMLSPGIASEASFATIGRYTVFAAAAISVFFHSNFIVKRTPIGSATFATILLGFIFVVHSFIVSPFADVSAFKALSWTLVMTTSVAAWSGLGDNERELLSRQIFGGLSLVMLVSLPLLALPLGYLRNGTGFQGVLNHPQVFGPTMALLGSWAASQAFGQRKPSWTALLLVIASFVMVSLSESRTAGLALILGVGTSIILIPFFSGHSIRSILPGLRSRRVHIFLAIGLTAAIFVGQQFSEQLRNYIVKRGQGTNLAEAYVVSRGHLMEQMFDNFKNNPLEGIGFGIASFPESMQIQRDPVLGFPISAAIEKGVLPLAALEELGIIGFTAIAVWVWFLLRRSALGGLTPLAVALTALLLNMGESTLFSPGGLGLLTLILLGWAFTYRQLQESSNVLGGQVDSHQ